jgi:hypothetical protein
MSDPSSPHPNYLEYEEEPLDISSSSNDLQGLLETQLRIAGALQQLIIRDQRTLSARDFKDLSSAASSLIALSHRTERTLEEISTYRIFASTVLEFLRNRSDSLGEDLLEELHRVAHEMSTTDTLIEVSARVAQP